jgi:hypothetical protein
MNLSHRKIFRAIRSSLKEFSNLRSKEAKAKLVKEEI